MATETAVPENLRPYLHAARKAQEPTTQWMRVLYVLFGLGLGGTVFSLVVMVLTVNRIISFSAAGSMVQTFFLLGLTAVIIVLMWRMERYQQLVAHLSPDDE